MEKLKSIDDATVGMFLKVQQYGGTIAERISCSGEVTSVEGDIIEIKTTDGTFGLPYNDDEFTTDFFILNKRPNGWDNFISGDGVKDDTPPEFKTKKDIVFDIVKNNPRKKFQGLLSEVKSAVAGDDELFKQYINIALVKFRS